MAVLSSEFLALITSEHNQRPNYMSTVEITVLPWVDGANLALSLDTLFDLDTSVGEQEDFLGQWVGVTRFITSVISVFFSFDTNLLGFDQGRWRTPYDAGATTTNRLDDEAYRTLLRARIASNYWDGTIEGAYKAWDVLFEGTGYKVIIQDGESRTSGPDGRTHGSMHIKQIILGPPLDVLTGALFTGGYLTLKSAAVGLKLMQQSPGYETKPVFGFGGGPASGSPTYPPTVIAGFNMGAWAVPIKPPGT